MTETDTETDAEPLHIAVTGAAGYIGSRVIRLLQETHSDWEITALDNFYHGTVRSIGDVDVEYVDIRHRNRLETALSGADIVMHLAAISGVDGCDANQDLAYDVNVTGTGNVAWFCRQTDVGLIFPFSMAVLGDPENFPITVEQPRDPMNWYGQTKVLGENLIDGLADGAFPAHLFLKSNLYGEHLVGDQRVSKGTVINFFVDRVFEGEPLTVYEPGSQSRNYVHVDDVARAYVRSAERMRRQLMAGNTGVERYEIASEEDLSVMTVAETVQTVAAEVADVDVDIDLVENPRGNETLVEEFGVDISRARRELDWGPTHTIKETVTQLLTQKMESEGNENSMAPDESVASPD